MASGATIVCVTQLEVYNLKAQNSVSVSQLGREKRCSVTL
jgi:hypothetical protein